MRTPHFRRDDACGTRRSAAPEREDVMRTALFLLSTAAVALAAIPAQAQTAGPADEAATGAENTYGEILVTAQRRSELVQDVPIALSPFNTDLVAASGPTHLPTLNRLAPPPPH